MSRYVIDKADGKRAVIGWDNPMQTFFAQLFASVKDYDNDEHYRWVGITPGEFPEPEGFIRWFEENFLALSVLAKYSLHEDYRKRTEPTPLQKFGLKMAADIERDLKK